MMKLMILIPFLFLGCGPSSTIPLKTFSGTDTESRFQVERVGVFDDDLAYHDKRGIYILKDSKTGKEFIGVSGIGVSELGNHASGKTRINDER